MKPLVIQLREWKCDAGWYRIEVIVRSTQLEGMIRKAILAQGRRTEILDGGIVVRAVPVPVPAGTPGAPPPAPAVAGERRFI